MNDSEALFTFWQNTTVSDHDNETEREFPQWRSISSLLLLGLWLISVLLTTTLSISVPLATVKSSFNRKLGSIHSYVLVVSVFARVSTTLAVSIQIPSTIKFCDCSIVSSVSFYLQLFSICYQPYILASLAVFQLLIIKGKKKFVKYKTIGVTLFIVTALAIALPLIFVGEAANSNGAVLCDSTIQCNGLDTARLLSIIASFHVAVWVPSVSVLVTATIWSCAIFKKNYAGHDNELT